MFFAKHHKYSANQICSLLCSLYTSHTLLAQAIFGRVTIPRSDKRSGLVLSVQMIIYLVQNNLGFEKRLPAIA